MSDEKSLPDDNRPVSAEPGTTGTGGSNPTPRTILLMECLSLLMVQKKWNKESAHGRYLTGKGLRL